MMLEDKENRDKGEEMMLDDVGSGDHERDTLKGEEGERREKKKECRQ